MTKFKLVILFSFFMLPGFAPCTANGGPPSDDDCDFIASLNAPKPIVLYKKNGKLKKKYAYRLRNAEGGDILQFDEDTFFQLRGVLGQGDQTRIFDLGADALRVPLIDPRSTFVGGSDVSLGSFTSFIDSNQGMLNAGAQVVRVDQKESRRGVYARVEKLAVLATYEDFLNKTDRWKALHLSWVEEMRAREAFLDFAQSFWEFEIAGELKPKQIGYDGKKWTMFDGRGGNYFVSSFSSTRHPFETQLIDGDWGVIVRSYGNEETVNQVSALIRLSREKAKAEGWNIRPVTAASDTEINFLINSPYPAILPEGIELTAQRLNHFGYNAMENDLTRGKTRTPIPFTVGKWIRTSGDYSLYHVAIENKGDGYLILRDKFPVKFAQGVVEEDEIDVPGVERRFKRELPAGAFRLDFGYDYLLLSDQ